MEFSLTSRDCAIPVEITVDDDNGRYMIRKSDTSGEVFNDAKTLIKWVQENLHEEEFCHPNEFQQMLTKLTSYANNQ